MKIDNRKGQKVDVLAEVSKSQNGLVFIEHGLGGFKEQKHIEIFADAFKEQGFTVVRFDATNALGESDGKFENATPTNYYEDLEDVISWAKTQDWYEEPFWLSGHSLGSFASVLYAENYPNKIKAIAPISCFLSGKQTLEKLRKFQPEELKEWEQTGWQITESASKPGVIKKLKWNHFIEDALKYNVLKDADKLTMPVLLITGEKDRGTTPEHHQILLDKISGEKELHIIKDADHNFRGADQEGNLLEIKQILLDWIEKVQSSPSNPQ